MPITRNLSCAGIGTVFNPFVPSDLPDILGWHDLGLSTEAVNPDGTGGAPAEGQNFAWMTSLTNDGTGTNLWTLLSADTINNKQPKYRTNIINSLPAGEFVVQSDNTQNSLLYTQSNQTSLVGDPAISFYCVAKLSKFDSQYRPLWGFGNDSATGKLFAFASEGGNWFINGQNINLRYGVTDGNWHLFTVIKPVGNFLAGTKFYIDGVLQVGTPSGSDQPLNIADERFVNCCVTPNSLHDHVWQGYLAAQVGYNAAHTAPQQAQVEDYLATRFGL